MRLRSILEEIKPPEGKGILILDIDDTLVRATGVYIYKKDKNGKEVAKFEPEDFAKEDVKAERAKGFSYDYRDFDNPEKLYNSIIEGEPLIKNLKIFDAHINAGWDIGFLTARGVESANKAAIFEWLKYRDKKGNLIPLPKERVKYFIAINDPKRQAEVKKRLESGGDFDVKGIYLQDIQKAYDRVKFVDDDLKNVISARKVLPKKDVIVAH